MELATFGTILLFCLAMLVNFGLQANYQQETEMKAFRKSMKQSYDNTNKGPSSGSDVTLVEDKIGINAQDPYGVSERYPFMAGSKVTWTNDLMDEYLDSSNTPVTNYLPYTSYEVNGQVLGPFTTANYERIPCVGNIIVRVPLLEKDTVDTNGDGLKDTFWRDITVNCATQTKVAKDELSKDDPKPIVGYLKNPGFPSGEKEQIGSVLRKKEGEETYRQMTVIKTEGNFFKKWKDGKEIEYGGPILAFWVIDTGAGEIDTSIEVPIKADGSKDLETYANSRQGLWPNYTRTITKTGTMSKTENEAEITTTTSASVTENIKRWLRLNTTGTAPVDSNVSTGDRTITWTSPK